MHGPFHKTIKVILGIRKDLWIFVDTMTEAELNEQKLP